jgi:hypothetical protein
MRYWGGTSVGDEQTAFAVSGRCRKDNSSESPVGLFAGPLRAHSRPRDQPRIVAFSRKTLTGSKPPSPEHPSCLHHELQLLDASIRSLNWANASINLLQASLVRLLIVG